MLSMILYPWRSAPVAVGGKPWMTTPVWKILVLMSMLGMTMRYQETRKLNQTTYVTDYLLRNGYLTTVRVSSGHMDIVDPQGIRVAYADIEEPVEMPPGAQSTLKIRVILSEPLGILIKRYPSDAQVTFKGYIIYDTGWLSWLFGYGRLEFEEKVPMSMILEYLGLYEIETAPPLVHLAD